MCLSNHNAGYKRLDRAVRAVCKISKKYKKIKLILVGQGTYTFSLKKLSDSQQGGENIIFLPKVDHNEIPIILGASDLYLNTNDVSNLSHPVLEAMTAGTPIISMDDGSLDDLVNHGKTESSLIQETLGNSCSEK